MTAEVRVAVDTTVLVNFLTGGRADDPSHLPHSMWVFRAAQEGIHRLVVPAIVIAEVAGAGQVRGSHLPSRERHARVRKVMDWLRGGDFIVADVDERVARRAAELAVKHQLKGADACILAAAELARCTALYSWDSDHARLDGAVEGLAITEPKEKPLHQEAMDFPQ